MAVAVGLDRTRLGDARLLAQPGQRVEFAEKGDHRAAFASFSHDRGRDVGEVSCDAKFLTLELLDMLGDGTMLGILQFRHAPDAVAQRLECVFLGIDQAPDWLAIVHSVLASQRSCRALRCHDRSGFAMVRPDPRETRVSYVAVAARRWGGAAGRATRRFIACRVHRSARYRSACR